MSNAARSLTLALALALMATQVTACGKAAPTAAATTAKKTATTKAPTAPVAQATATPAPVKTAPAVTDTGTVLVMLSSFQAEGVAGIAVQLQGDAMAEPIGSTLEADKLATSNTLAFEHIPVGTLKASILAFDENEEAIAQMAADVVVTKDGEAKVAIQLSPGTGGAGGAPVAFKQVDPTELDATPAPTPTATPDADEEEAGDEDATETTEPTANGKKLAVEITDMQTVRKFLLFKKLQVTVRVTNESTTETLDGEVKVEYHKLKGIFTKEDAIVETLTAPVEGLAPGKSVEVTLMSSVAAENAEATVHTVVSSSSASTF